MRRKVFYRLISIIIGKVIFVRCKDHISNWGIFLKLLLQLIASRNPYVPSRTWFGETFLSEAPLQSLAEGLALLIYDDYRVFRRRNTGTARASISSPFQPLPQPIVSSVQMK